MSEDEQPRKPWGSNRPTIGNPENFTTVLIKMILVIVTGIVGGYFVDDYFRLDWPIFMIIFGIMSAFIASFMYQMYKSDQKDDGEGEEES